MITHENLVLDETSLKKEYNTLLVDFILSLEKEYQMNKLILLQKKDVMRISTPA